MLKSLKKEIAFAFPDERVFSLISLGIMLFADTITFCILKFVNFSDKTFFAAGSFIAMCITGFFAFFLTFNLMSVHYDIAVSMGRSRKAYILNVSVSVFLNSLLNIVILALLSNVYPLIKALFFPELPFDGEFYGTITLDLFIKNIWWGLLIILAAQLSGIIMSAMIKQYGRNALWGFWAIYMIVILGGRKIADIFSSYNISFFIPGIAVGILFLSLSIYSVVYLLKADVQN